MTEASGAAPIAGAIAKRAARRGLHVDIERLRYANQRLFDGVTHKRGRALYVGVGHGHDALLALTDGLCNAVVGVDPYLGEHGNDTEDYDDLLSTIETLGLGARFTVARQTIQDYLATAAERFDCIIFNDVLHHIYVTAKPLHADTCFAEAERLFEDLTSIASADATLVIADVERHGLRPLLTRAGVLKGNIDYATKQAREEWTAAATAGGWHPTGTANYIPWRFRAQTGLWSGTVGRWTLCDKYFLWFENAGSRS